MSRIRSLLSIFIDVSQIDFYSHVFHSSYTWIDNVLDQENTPTT